MLSYTVKATVLQDPKSSLLGFCDLIIADSIVIPGYKIWRKKDGDTFVAPPQIPAISGKDDQGHLIPKMNDKGKETYNDVLRYIDAKENEADKQTILQKEIAEEMLQAFFLAQKGGVVDAPTKKAPPPTVETPKTVKAPTVQAKKPSTPW